MLDSNETPTSDVTDAVTLGADTRRKGRSALFNEILDATSVRAKAADKKAAAPSDPLLKQVAELGKEFREAIEMASQRGNSALHASLGKAVDLYQKIAASANRDVILNALRAELKTNGIRLQSNTPPTSVVARALLKGSRSSTHVYSRAIELAVKEDIAPDDLPDVLAARGGLAKFVASASNKLMAKKHAVISAVVARAGLAYESMQANDVFAVDAGERHANQHFVVRICIATGPNEATAVWDTYIDAGAVDSLVRKQLNFTVENLPVMAKRLLTSVQNEGREFSQLHLDDAELADMQAVADMTVAEYQQWLTTPSNRAKPKKTKTTGKKALNRAA